MRKRLLAALSGVPLLLAAGPAAADAAVFIDRVSWVRYDGLPTLRVYPSAAGRDVAGQLGKTTAQSEEAWREILSLAPDAATAGMREQFLCHWNFAEFAQPGKTSWDLEPWRPAVDDSDMLLAGCNPGGAELG